MAGRLLSNLKYILILVLLIGGSWLLRNYFDDLEVIEINGDAATVIDGDSFETAKDEFRLRGIDAPEFMQSCNNESGTPWRCGQFARSVLQQNLAEQNFSCEVLVLDRFGRKIVDCSSPQTPDLGAWLVAEGAALSGYYFDEKIYAADEAAAKKAKKGIWRGEFIKPADWRAQNLRN